MASETARSNFGIDVGSQLSVVDAIEWATEKGFGYVDVQPTESLGARGNDDPEIGHIIDVYENHSISLGLHTLSAVNTAEFTPPLKEAVREYLFTFIDIAAAIDADRTIVHAGYHFTSDAEKRRETSLKRLKELLNYAGEKDVTVLLENMNPEPDNAEVHYLCSGLKEAKWYFDSLSSPKLRWAFNPPHAHLHQEGIDGFLDTLDFKTCGEVRLNDNHGVYEEHLMIGEGTINFEHLFDRLDGMGYDGPYIVALGTKEDSLQGVQRLIEMRER